jgi:hypothetical protein
MPYKKGYSPASKSFNYKHFISLGYSPERAKAAMLRVADEAAKKAGKPSKGPAAPKKARKKKG